jgi:hypothetical protein
LGTADADNVTITPELICTVATATASTRTGSGSQALPSGWRMADTLSTATISARYTDMFNAFGSPATIVSSSAASNADDAVLIIPDVFDSGMLAIDGLIGTATAVDWLVEVLR